MIANHAGEVLRALQEGLIDPWDVYATRFGEQVESYRLVEKMLRSFMDGRPIDVFHVGARGTMNEPEQKPMTLKVFIEENHRLISVIGVMAALLLFSWRIGDKPGGWISLCLSTCLMILTVELYAQLPGKGRSLRLAVFELGFFGALVGVFVYWLLLAEKHLRGMVLIFPAAFMIVFATYWLSEKTGLTRRKWMIRFRWIRPALALLILVAGFYLGGLVAFRYYAPLHGVLESVRGTLGLADVADSVATSRTVIEGAGPPQAPTPRVPAAASPR